MSLTDLIKLNLVNVPGWRTKRRIVVFESDDWGSIRMASKKAFNNLKKLGYTVENHVYNANDILESNDDLERLFDVLNLYKDKKNNSPIFTINNIVANPDFDRIEENNFSEYYYELFTDTLKKYPNHDRVLQLYFEGLENCFLKPQFHGREHVHVIHWMDSLKSRDKDSMEAFKNRMFTLNNASDNNCKTAYLDAFGTYNDHQVEKSAEVIKEGLDIFEQIWGFRSKTIIPPCYVWHPDIELFFKNEGIEIIQCSRVQKIPQPKKKYKIERKYTGQKNEFDLYYTVRNVVFEPSENQDLDWVSKAMNEISTSFLWNKPAIISTHRVNYVSGLNIKNADESLIKLKKLLQRITEKWPDVEFMSSDELGKLIAKQ